MSEPFMHHWQWWAMMTETICVQASDTLRVVISDYTKLPMNVSKGYRGLDALRAEIKNGRPGIIIRR
jgi:hypothetical protein